MTSEKIIEKLREQIRNWKSHSLRRLRARPRLAMGSDRGIFRADARAARLRNQMVRARELIYALPGAGFRLEMERPRQRVDTAENTVVELLTLNA